MKSGAKEGWLIRIFDMIFLKKIQKKIPLRFYPKAVIFFGLVVGIHFFRLDQSP
jgi:hypothetical protein